MGKLIIVVGNTGVGKTTLTRLLCASGNFTPALEGHIERPFQALFKADPCYALPNQIDYLLLRAEQERSIRSGTQTGVQDGGLEMDFFVFTRLFRQKGYLSADEFSLCERLYVHVRAAYPPPEGIIHLTASLDLVEERFLQRGRALEIAERDDLRTIQILLDDWLSGVDPSRVIHVDASNEDVSYSRALPDLLKQISGFKALNLQ